MTRKRRMLIAIPATVFALWLAVVLLAACSYRRLLYPAPSGAVPALPKEVERTFTARDGVPVHALFLPPPSGAKTVVFFHGNGQLAEDAFFLAEAFHARGLGAAVIEYRGYGKSRDAGRPTEAGLYADAEGALDGFAELGIGPDRVILCGQSLGTGVATEMAARKKGSALVLLSPFTSIPQVAAQLVPILLPVRLIVGDRYDNVAKAKDVTVPTLIVHGDEDALIPHDMGVLLSKTFPRAELVTIHGAGHNDLFAHEETLPAILSRVIPGG
jgi:fermentation-respiration switch protein FrsA (DUF1100 family)